MSGPIGQLYIMDVKTELGDFPEFDLIGLNKLFYKVSYHPTLTTRLSCLIS